MFTDEKKIIIISSVIIVITSSILIFDLRFRHKDDMNSGDRVYLGYISEIDNNVKTKHGFFPVWEKSNIYDELYELDMLYTGDNSLAGIGFVNDSFVLVEENSLVILKSDIAKRTINILAGRLVTQTDKQTTVDIQTPQGLLKIYKNSEAVVNIKDNKDVIIVKKGRASYIAENRTVDIEKNRELIKGKTIIKNRIEIEPVYPGNNQTIYSDSGSNIEFKWKDLHLNKNRYYFIIEVSLTNNFNKIILSGQTTDEKISLNIREGIYYWRVNCIDKNDMNKTTGYSNRFKIKNRSSVKLLKPYNGEIFNSFNSVIDFDWENYMDVSHYIINVSDTPSFKKIIYSKDVIAPPVFVTGLKENKYFWRIGMVTKVSNKVLWSDISGFEIRNPIWLKQDQITANKILLKWEKTEYFEYYLVKISESSDFSNNVVEGKVVTDYYSWENNKAGQYYARIAGYDSAGKKISESNVVEFSFTDKAVLEPIYEFR